MADPKNLKHNYGTINKEYGIDLATRAPEDDGPIYMVNLMKYHEVAQYEDGGEQISGREADDRYNPANVLSKIGATIVFVGDVMKNHVGDEDWDRIAIVRYATRRSFIDMQRRDDFGEKHKHKAAGMLRTIIAGCRPVDASLDERGRPAPLQPASVLMIVRNTDDRGAAFDAISGSVDFEVENTIIGDDRRWDTVQFVLAESPAAAEGIAASLQGCEPGSSFVMSLRTTIDGITRQQ